MPEVRIVVVDSLSAACARRDENSSQMLQVVTWLATLARDTGKPILVTHHLRKRGLLDGDGPNLDRLRGSSSIVQTARMVWAIDAPDSAQPERLRLSVIKSNLARFPSPIGLSIDESGLTFGPAPEKPRVKNESEKAREFLLSELSGGPVKKTVLDEKVRKAGISVRAIKRVKDDLGAVSRKVSGEWWWSFGKR